LSRPAEETSVHTRLLKCALVIDEARAYWQQVSLGQEVSSQEAFEGYWFGAKSLPRVKVLLTNFRARFDAFPPSLEALHRWQGMTPDTRACICHWHLQLSDPLYRAFTGTFLVDRRTMRPEITRDRVIAWVGEQGGERWTMPSRIQLASKLLSAAFSAGLVGRNRDPRPLTWPRVDDVALTYLMYLLRGVDFDGSMLENPYLRSVGLDADTVARTFQRSSALQIRRQSGLVDISWQHDGLLAWAEHDGLLAARGEP